MVRHIHQYGGTKISIQDDTTKQWMPTTDRTIISEKIMENLVLLRTIAPDSKCSMVLLGNLNPNGDIRKRSQIYQDETGAQFTLEERADRPEYVEQGKIETGVVIKISLVTRSRQAVNWRRVVKETTTRNEIAREVETQHTVAMRMLCGQKASDIIPDIFSDCFLTVDEFSKQLTVKPDDELTREIVEWIKTTARAKRECVIHIAFMDYVDGYDTFKSFYITTRDNVKLQLPTLYQAVAVILTLLLKGRIMSFDFHHRNLLTNGSKVMCLDLGRIYDFSKADTLSVLIRCLEWLFLGSNGIRYSKIIGTFFNVDFANTDLKTKFSIDFERLLKKPDDEVYGFSSLSPVDKRKFVYETLIFIAFIDGITNTCRYGVIDKSIQFSHVLRRVFHSINVDKLFSNFDIFLSKFTIDYDEFCRLNPDLVDNMNIALDEISRRLADMLGACPSRHYHPSHFDFSDHPAGSALEPVSVPASSSSSAAAAAKSNDTGFTPIGLTPVDGGFFKDDPAGLGFGGSKRLRRRNSNKKRNHKSRNKQTRRRRRRNSTRRRVTRHH
jgi:hypothetical protein